MKTLLIIDANLGQARAYMAKTLLGAAAQKAHLEIIDNPNDAELAIVLGDTLPADSSLNGKKVWLGDIGRAVAHPELFLSEAKGHAKPYSAPVATAPVASSGPKRVVAVTACPTGVAHTFMAAEAIETEAKKRGWWVKVETRGSVGAGNAITPEEVAQADLVIVAADIEVDLAKFAGKPMYRTSTGLALKKTKQELDKALEEATPYQPTGKAQTSATESKKESAGAYRHLLTGVSYMLPMVVAGGLCIALSFAFGIEAFKEQGTLAAALMQIGGGSAFALMVPVLAGYIAFSIADRPGLTPGLIGGMLAVSTGWLYWRDYCWFPCRLCGEAYQHEVETPAEYGSAETDPDHSAVLKPGGWSGHDLPDRQTGGWHSGRSDPLAANHGYGECGAAWSDSWRHDVYRYGWSG